MSTPTLERLDRNPPDERAGASGMRTDIQALRALAVMLVVVYHLWPGELTGGFVGVDVFFVISGFLITGHLLRDAERKGGVSLVQFWTRRAFRLLPASLLVIVVTMAGVLAFVGEDQWRRHGQQALASGFYVQNWVLSASSTDYLASSESPTAFQHFWSLSIEEQFYLVLPVLFVAVLALSKTRWRAAFFAALVAITGASLWWSIQLTATNSAAAYFVTTTRAWEFGIGALASFVRPRHLARISPAVAWVGIAAIVVSAVTFSGQTAFPGYAALLPTVGAALALITLRHDRVFDAVTNTRPVQLIGDASYSIYLWHWPLFVIAPFALGRELGFLPRLGILVLSIVVGWLSMRFVETPFRARGFARWRTRSGAAVAAGIAGVLVLSTAGLGLVQQREQQAADQVQDALSGADRCVGAPALGRSDCPAPESLTPSLALLPKDDGNRGDCWTGQGSSEFKRCTLNDPAKPAKRVIALGDSHSNSLIPAYEKAAKALNWRFEASGKAGCYPTTADIEVVDRDVTACETWRKDVIDQVAKDDSIDIVVMTRNEASPTELTPEKRRGIEAGMREAWSRFTRAGKQVIVIQDVPNLGQEPLDCVARNGVAASTECTYGQDAAFPESRQTLRDAAEGQRGVTFVGVEDSFCVDGRCPAVIGSVPVFFNPGHLSKTFAATWGPQLASKLRDAAQ
ncbi:acyltransferase family protein [Barrientosiimonas humi]|uniref:acyltransferase family protein n=1 Tax=Barrientosiimonas humi TaxID=999931 RepID=UPI00370D77D1